jgi:hypothetical protein
LVITTFGLALSPIFMVENVRDGARGRIVVHVVAAGLAALLLGRAILVIRRQQADRHQSDRGAENR